MSFEEKSIVASLLITLVVWGNYFYRVYQYSQEGLATMSTLGGLLTGAVVLTVIIEIVAQAVIAGYSSRSGDATGRTDERDRAIVYHASYQASYVLAAGIVMSVLVAFVTEDLVSTLNTLIVHFIAAEVWRYVTQLYLYRRGF